MPELVSSPSITNTPPPPGPVSDPTGGEGVKTTTLPRDTKQEPAPQRSAARNFKDELREMDDDAPKPPKPPPPQKKSAEEKPKEAATAAAEDDFLGDGKPVVKEDAKPTDEEDDGEFLKKRGGIKEFRSSYDKLKQQKAELEERVAKLGKPAEDPDKKVLAESLTAKEKRIAELEQEVKFSNYERSDEYKSKFQVPYEETAKASEQAVIQLRVNPDGVAERNLTAAEFWNVVRISDHDAAIEAAERLVEGSKGAATKAAMIVDKRNQILSAFQKAETAKEEFRKTAAEREKTQSEQTAAQRVQQEKAMSERIATFKAANDEAVKRYPNWFAPEEGDKEGNDRLQKGTQFADTIFGDSSKVSPDRLVKMHSAARMQLASWPRLTYKLDQATAKVAELQKEIETLKGSGPGNGGLPGKVKAANGAKDYRSELMELERTGR